MALHVRVSGLIGTIAGAVVLSFLGPLPAEADDIIIPPGSILITQSQPDPAAPGATTLQVYNAPGQGILVNSSGNSVPVTPQCIPLPDTIGCVGSSDQVTFAGGQPELTVGNTVNGQEAYGGLPEKSILWIKEEAVDVLQSVGGVEGDGMVRSYAAPQIRGYVYTRILGILDKKLYGEPMTAPEEMTYAALMQLLKTREIEKAKQVLDEYTRWESNPCTYPVPTAPAGSPASPPNPIAGTLKCGKNNNPYIDASGFLKNTPEVETFEIWAAYRHPSPLIQQAANPEFKGMTASMIAGVGFFAALGLAAAAGAAATAIALALISTATAVSFLVATGAAAGGGSLAALSIAGGAGALAGAAAAGIGAIVFMVVLALVATGVSIWAIVKEESIGKEIRKRVTEAAQNDDPLGIEQSKPAYAGLDFDTREQPGEEDRALHTQTPFQQELLALVAEWTMLSPTGTFVPDANSGYGSPESGPNDTKFLVNGVPRDTVAVLAPDGALDWTGQAVSGYRVHFSRGWLMVSPFRNGAFQPAKPSLSVNYVNEDGTTGQMSVTRKLNDEGEIERQFNLLKIHADGTASATFSDHWVFRGSGDTITDATLAASSAALPAISLVPTAHGRMTPGSAVTFQSNVSQPGVGVPGTYSWKIDRLDDDGQTAQSWTEGNLVGFQQRFDVPGNYRGHVRFQGTKNGVPFDVSGTVPFKIGAPVPELYSTSLGAPRLRDDLVNNNRLSLDVRIMQNTPSDATTPEMLDVEVEWADDLKGNKVVEHYAVKCVPVGDGTCETGALTQPAAAPINPQWSASPSYDIPDDQQFLPYVVMKVTNAYGATAQYSFRIPGEHRPRFVDSTPTVEMPMGTFSRVHVTEVIPTTLVPPPPQPGIDLITIQPYLNQIQAELPEGVQAGVVKEGSRYFVELFGSPSAEAIGPHTFTLPAEQEPRGSGLRAAPALVTLSVVSSLAPGYRAVLRGVPKVSERSYRSDWPEWYTQVPVRSDLQTDPPFTGTVMCKLVRFGQVVFDKPCAQDEKFPWPATLENGDYQASVRAVSNGQTVIEDSYTIGFSAIFLQPTLTLLPATGTARTQTIRLAITDQRSGLPGGEVPTPFSASGYHAFCKVDGAGEQPCLDGGTLGVTRTFGAHSVAVRVVAPDGAEATRTVSFTVPRVATTTRVGATYVRSTRRVAAAALVRDQSGQAANGQVQFVLRRGTTTVGTYTASLNRYGIARPVFAQLRRTGLYTLIANYRGAGLLRPSTGSTTFRVS